MTRRRRRSISSLLWKILAVICSPAPTATIIFTAQVTLLPPPFLPLLLLLSTLSLIQMLSCVGTDGTCDRAADHPKCTFTNELTTQQSARGTAQQRRAEIFHVALCFARVICH